MTIEIRGAAQRGKAEHGWLSSRHTFSFAEFHDPNRMGFRSLRVINEDRVQPGQGFGTHPHRDMEIISYVVEGALEHRDSMGNGSIIRAGDVQRMTAGTGVRHSEFNASASDIVHFLQIWILPSAKGLEPGYEQKHFAQQTLQDQLRLVVSPDGRDGSVRVNQDVSIFAGRISEGAALTHRFERGRNGWLQEISGEVWAAGEALESGDGLEISDSEELHIGASEDAHVLVFDLA